MYNEGGWLKKVQYLGQKKGGWRAGVISLLMMLWVATASAQLQADFTVSATEGCVPLAVAFRDQSTGNPERWLWRIGDGRTSGLANPAFLYLEPGEYTVSLTVYRGTTDSSTVTRTAFIKAYGFPTVSFAAAPPRGCAPLDVLFTNTSTPGAGSIARSVWDFGDGNAGSGTTVNHAYNTSGSYTVSLTVENSFGCARSLSLPQLVTVNDSIRARFDVNTTPFCDAPITASFTNTSIGAATALQRWSFGDGATSASANPSHIYTNTGAYTVQLIVTSAEGCSDTISQTLTFRRVQVRARFTAPDTVCKGVAARFTNTSTSSDSISRVLWRFGDGSTSTTMDPRKTYNTPGTYRVTLITYTGACLDSVSRDITILPGPDNFDFSGTPRVACTPPLRVSFSAQPGANTVVRWNLGNGQRPTTEAPVTNYDALGSYNVSLTVRAPNGCVDSLTRQSYIRIRPPVITNLPPLTYEGCFPYTHRFVPDVNSLTPIVSWEWDFGDGRTSTQRNPVITFTNDGEYKILLKVTSQDGCTDTALTIIRGGQPPKIDFTATPQLVCPEDTVRFFSSISGAFEEILWRFGDGGSSREINPLYRYNDTGFMTVSVTLSNRGCIDSLSYEDMIYVKPPIARFTEIIDCANQFFRQFRDESIGAEAWYWDFGTGDTSMVPNPAYTFPSTGWFTVKLRVTNGGCSHTTMRRILVLDEKARFSSDISGSCEGSRGVFSAIGIQDFANIARFRWHFGDGVVIEGRDSVINRFFRRSRQTTLSLSITDLNGCVDSVLTNLNIEVPGPEARIYPTTQLICKGSVAVFPDSTLRLNANPIARWEWHYGDGTVRTYTAPPFDHIYTDTGYYDVFLKVVDVNGCEDSIRMPRAVGVFFPEARFESVDTFVCLNTPVRFTNQSTGVGLRFRWLLGENDSSALAQPEKIFAGGGLYDISLLVTDTAQCTSRAERPAYIQVGGQAALFEMSDSAASCPPLRVEFTNTSRGALTYNWQFGNGNVSVLPNPVQTYTNAADYEVRLIITANGGCADTLVRRISIGGPQGDFTYGPLSGCPPLTVNFTSTTANVKSFIWDFSDGETDFGTDSTNAHTYINPGSYRPRVILEDGQSCRVSVIGAQTINVIGVRALIKPLEQYQYCGTATLAFSDSSIASENIRRWRWDFGDGTTSNLQNPTHTYTRPGRYRVQLYVETEDNCNSTAQLPEDVVIAPVPQIDIGNDTELCLPAALQFTANWLNADTTTLEVVWHFGLGGPAYTGGLTPPRIEYPGVGTYRTTLRAQNNYGCVDSFARVITITEVANVLFADIPQRLYCDSGVVRFQENVTASAPIAQWQWDFGDGNTSTDRNPVHTYRTPGVYQVRLQVQAVNDCISRGEFPGTIRLVSSPSIQPLADTSFCLPGTVLLSAGLHPNDTMQVSWQWQPSAGPPVNGSSAGTFAFAQPGTFLPRAIATNVWGCTDTAVKRIVVNDTPRLVVTPPTDVCLGNTQQLQVSGADAYSWSPANGLSCTTCANPVATIDSNRVYRVSGSTLAGCTREGVVPLRIIRPQPMVTGPGDTICTGEALRLFASGAQVYSWQPGTGLSATNIANPLATPLTSTVYRLIGSDTLGCFADTAYIPIVVFPRPTISIDPNRIRADIGTTVTLNAQAQNATRYRWTPANGLSCSDCLAPVATISRDITYRVEADNPGGCPATAEVVVEPICLAGDVFIPNTFSPNGDGRNDRFFPMGRAVSGIKSMRVFNRWGEMVFEKNNFNANDPSAGWDGTYKGKLLTPDVYVYVVVVLCHNTVVNEIKGNVTLLR